VACAPDGPAGPRLAQPPDGRGRLADRLAAARRLHLIGVGGTGMSSLATLLVGMGKAISGSDAGAGAVLDWLTARGVVVRRGHAAEHLDDPDLVVVSAAVPPDNPELAAARRRGVPVVSHAEALGALMATRRGIAVAGTHGKSSTTALIAHVLATAGRDPSLVGGAEALDFGASSHLGHGPELVAEADEYGRRFLQLHPDVAVITGIEPDHLDYYRDLAEIVGVFGEFVGGMAPDGVVVTFEDEPTLAGLELPRRRLRYGRSALADWRLVAYRPKLGGGCDFSARDPAGGERAYRLRLSGRHNAENALAAVAVADVLGVDDSVVCAALASFRGTRRRFETRARAGGVWIVDDYAHHPTAVRATLRAAREAHDGPIWAVFQPHTTNRTAALLDDFAAAFGDADHVLITPIYRPPGREVAPAAVTSEDLAARMDHPDTRSVPSFGAALAALEPALRPGTLVVILGAGDVATLADRLADRVTEGGR
jgi:UDP-N-acetylmuramate--alanine ligase